jgi:hypothetical protein
MSQDPDQKTRWQQYREAMQTLAATMGTTVECTGKYERLSVTFDTSLLSAEQAAALGVVEDLVELVSEFPPGFLEQLEPPSAV